MKPTNLLTFFLLTTLLTSCNYSEGDWGATVGNCDEICTVYYTAQSKLMKNRKLYAGDFPDTEMRRKHVKVYKNGHKIVSWFKSINEQGDTLKTNFSCEVYLSRNVDVGYYVENLKIE